jgi:uncharacterized membrane protein
MFSMLSMTVSCTSFALLYALWPVAVFIGFGLWTLVLAFAHCFAVCVLVV